MNHYQIPRLTVRRVGTVAAIAAALALTACSPPHRESEDTSIVADTGSATPSTLGFSVSSLLGPIEFAAFLEEYPTVPVVNVHIPYEGHLDGTDAFVAFDSIANWADLPADPVAPIALYCRSGSMSATAAATLNALGYSNIVELDGGMLAWEEAGLPLSIDQQAASD